MTGIGTGRLIEYDPQTGDQRVLIDELHFANGVAGTIATIAAITNTITNLV